ncbi:tetratricopeptide repeat-containing sulfotransferase family protein [Dyella mobilis]|uniref:Tetratricopeptide repeat protein n=1 Tax=Dyella mobilis TaxID=1849582 RepID=A0ABS2KIY4_9GAMM|nr:tetratricopeptide repeat-containing sulfotransferase family protein [Dyella mobilis]MBM7131115.1 tetratricopeptide repeat protein [Dyella mobilis]GLQ98951.1 sulfotransferase [Dyella mobilis]
MSQNATPSANQAPDKRDIEALVGLIHEKRHAEAESLARKLTEECPSSGLAWQALGASLKSQQRHAEAIDAQRHAVALSPWDALGHYALGESLMAVQQPAMAAESYHCARTIKPDFVDAHFKLGNALAMQQRLGEAIDAYLRVVEIAPQFAEAHANLGFTLMTAERYPEAETHLRQALVKHPTSMPLHNALGVVLYGQKQLTEAADHFREVVRLAPNEAEGHANLGNALRELGAHDEAEVQYRRAIALNERFARAHFDLASLHYLQERYADAERGYRRALELKPDYVEACNNLGRSIRRQGRLDEARECFEKAASIDPETVETYYNLASLRTFSAPDPEPAQLEKLVFKLPFLPENSRIRYWFAMGKMRTDLGRYDDAFNAYAEGNRLKHSQLGPDEASRIALIENIRSTFNQHYFDSRPAPRGNGRSPIFIVGMPRSGTSLIEQILSSHPDIHGAGELTELEDIVFALAKDAGRPVETYPEIAARLSAEELLRLGNAYIDRVWTQAPEAARITDKMMSNFAHVGMIRQMFPNAKIIHAMRDPMDSCFSCYATLFAKNNLDFSYDLGSLGRYYVRYIQLMAHWQQVLPPGSILELRYEDVVADTEGQARRLLDYLELTWDPRCLSFHENRRIVKTASAAQVRRPIYKSSVARWKHFESHLAPLLDIVKNYR